VGHLLKKSKVKSVIERVQFSNAIARCFYSIIPFEIVSFFPQIKNYCMIAKRNLFFAIVGRLFVFARKTESFLGLRPERVPLDKLIQAHVLNSRASK
jgi:hypothetical protein